MDIDEDADTHNIKNTWKYLYNHKNNLRNQEFQETTGGPFKPQHGLITSKKHRRPSRFVVVRIAQNTTNYYCRKTLISNGLKKNDINMK